MLKKLLAILPVAGVLTLAGPVATSQAAMSGALAVPASEATHKTDAIKVARRGRGFRRGVRRGRRIRRGPRFVFRYGAPLVHYGYRVGRRCHWLKRRARITGSRYWWRRYRNCRRYY